VCSQFGCRGRTVRPRLPGESELAARSGAVPEVEVDQRLGANPGLLGQLLEVGDRRLIQTDRDLPRQPRRIGIPGRFGEVVLFPQLTHLSA